MLPYVGREVKRYSNCHKPDSRGVTVNGTLSASALFAVRTELLGDGWFQWVDFSSNYIKRRGKGL